MPLLGGVFLDTVYSEGVNRSAESTDHQVENGADITDHVKPNADKISISGVLNGRDASARSAKLNGFKNQGTLLTYSYRNVIKNAIVTSYNSTHDKEVKGGLKFDISLKVIRLSKPLIVKAKKTATKKVDNKGLQQPTNGKKAKVHVVKPGENLSKIASRYKVNANKLYEKNKGIIGKNRNLIRPGQKLVIPA